MDKNAIKKYAVWARNELIARVTQKAEQYEITEKKTTPKDADSINGRLLTDVEKNQRKALIEKIQADGFEQVMEEVAYTWFNRFTALRFMEVNNYLPSHTRVFTNEAGEFKPQILADAIQLDLEGLNMDKVFELKDANKTEELYKYLLITQCNALSAVLPRMFQKIEHYTELLLPDYLLREGSVIEQMITLIPEEDWTDQVQIIGWLYQFYNSEPKDAVFAALKKNVKITKENIPAATQLFTPDWIVRYMVENSLGRLWLEGHSNNDLKAEWNYYLDETEQEESVQKQLDELRKGYSTIKPEDIRCIDPSMGSGHILCYMFDVLIKIYEDYGYTAREAAENIVAKNLWGLDIDERAAQLSYFAVMMKARQYDRRFFNKKDENGELCIPQPHVYAIEESNGITSAPMHDMGVGLSQEEYGKAVKEAMRLVDEMHDAKEYGSIIHITPCDWSLLRRFAIPRWISEGQMRMDIHGEIEASERLQMLINIGETLSQRYDVASTNPPYMGSGNMGSKLLDYIKKNYPDSKTDLYSVFIERCMQFCKKNGYFAMITQHSWMFLSRFEKMRANLQRVETVNMAHLGPRAFEEIGGEVVPSVTFGKRNSFNKGYKGTYCRLLSGNSQDAKEKMFLSGENRYVACQDNFDSIYGVPVAYWISDSMMKAFSGKALADFGKTRQGFATGDNDRFLRQWTEIDFSNLLRGCSSSEEFWARGGKYAPCNKGGESRKWYGNNYIVCKYDKLSYDALLSMGNHLPSREYYFRSGLTWSTLSSGFLSMRYSEPGYLFETKGSMYFADDENDNLYLLGLMNSKVAMQALQVLCPTIDFHEGPVSHVPVIMSGKEEIEPIVKSNIEISKKDWDSYEISWDFQKHPFIGAESIESGFRRWEEECNRRFDVMKSNDEKINSIFIDKYQLQDELSPDVDEKTITISRAELKRDVKSFISYAVGCMFGRYSLDEDGIVYAGGKWDSSRYRKYLPDNDGIIPICSDEYFEDDIVGRFVKFVKCAFGEDSLEENLAFVANAIGGKGTSREVLRNYFINGFYSDHLKVYQKKPIYWLFSSGNKNGFKCLVYMHRYRPDTIARIRTDYVHEQQSRYRTAISDLENRVNGATTADRVRLNKDLQRLQDQAEEIRLYEEKIHHLADQMIEMNIDDGVKKNYDRFKDVLEKLK